MLQIVVQPSMFHTNKYNFEAKDESNKTFSFNPECENLDFQREITVKNYITQKAGSLIFMRQQNFAFSKITQDMVTNLGQCKEHLKQLSKTPYNQLKESALLMIDYLENIKPHENSNFYNHFCKVQKSILDTINKYL